MATIFNEGARSSDWLKREGDNYFSREQGILIAGSNAAGAVTASGTILGRITASGKLKPVTVAAVDGSQNAVGVLLDNIDASAADRRVVYIARDAIVQAYNLVYGADVDTAPERAAIHAALAALNPPILVREGA